MRVLLYKRCVNEIILVVRNMVRYDSGNPRDEANMCMVQEAAKTINPSIEVTFEIAFPSMKILRSQCWI